jgi:3-deoxy-D-manno-octulosonic-acid transferase
MLRRGNWQENFGQRFAKYRSDLKQALTNRHVIWLHAVSVGEVNLCTQLIRALEPRLPNAKIVVSTTTTTGMAELKRRLPNRVSKIYYPIDRQKYVNRAIATINPEAIILVEAEIWPNFIQRVSRLKLPLFLVNARLSERSFPRYRRFGFLFRPLFGAFTGVGCQNEEDAGRLREVGCRAEVVQVVGNLKFDAAKFSERPPLDVRGLLTRLGVAADALIVVAGSTHDGEEVILADMIRRLRGRFPKVFLVLVPRHAERARDVGKRLRERKMAFVYRSDINDSMRFREGEVECLLVNTTGELRYFYGAADVVFVGKSLTAKGGQNPIEPGAQGKAIIFGPNMQNFSDVVRIFRQRDGAVQVGDAAGLEKGLGDLLGNPERRFQLGKNAQAAVAENLGSLERTVEMILQQLAPRGVYIAPPK